MNSKVQDAEILQRQGFERGLSRIGVDKEFVASFDNTANALDFLLVAGQLWECDTFEAEQIRGGNFDGRLIGRSSRVNSTAHAN